MAKKELWRVEKDEMDTDYVYIEYPRCKISIETLGPAAAGAIQKLLNQYAVSARVTITSGGA